MRNTAYTPGEFPPPQWAYVEHNELNEGSTVLQ